MPQVTASATATGVTVIDPADHPRLLRLLPSTRIRAKKMQTTPLKS